MPVDELARLLSEAAALVWVANAHGRAAPSTAASGGCRACVFAADSGSGVPVCTACGAVRTERLVLDTRETTYGDDKSAHVTGKPQLRRCCPVASRGAAVRCARPAAAPRQRGAPRAPPQRGAAALRRRAAVPKRVGVAPRPARRARPVAPAPPARPSRAGQRAPVAVLVVTPALPQRDATAPARATCCDDSATDTDDPAALALAVRSLAALNIAEHGGAVLCAIRRARVASSALNGAHASSLCAAVIAAYGHARLGSGVAEADVCRACGVARDTLRRYTRLVQKQADFVFGGQ